ncbi:protein shank, partial [Trichonephila clavata]
RRRFVMKTLAMDPDDSISPNENLVTLKVYIPDLLIQKSFQFQKDEFIWDIKEHIIDSLPKELKENFNYGIFCPPINGKAGKFLDEQRPLADYPFYGSVGYVELRYKRRVYKMMNVEEKQIKQLHTRASAEAYAAYEKAQKAFLKDDSLAQLILVGNMDDSNAELTSVCNTAKSVWEKLLSVYEQSSRQRLDRLMEKFFRSEKELEYDIASHIAKLQRNFSELNYELRRVAKTTLPDLLVMSRIISTLPSEYFESKSVWESVPIEERSVNKLTERLHLIEIRLPSKSTDSTTLFATRKKVFKKPEKKCYVYRKLGHLAKDCWKKESKLKVEGYAFVCTIEGVPESEVWIADIGASAHMTKHKNCFVDFIKFVSPKSVYVENSDAIMAYGQGTVNIEIKVNSKWERHHLTEVWDVPDISRNLFSISQTLKKGFKLQASKYECSLLRDDRVRLKGSKKEVSKCLEMFLNEAKNTGHKIKEVLSHGGGEVINSTVKSVLEKSGISSHMEIVKKPLQTPEADVKKEIEEISCNAEDTEET